ncbi:hypothetical protein EVAR_47484_1 [Eumeta japonica]|uniref:Uncharacterized protein n=1 Tax=Eumeta variegata TaxID=151549 RepID=A0A4C1XAE4_EUMVA|nr:hypothetical protein EVAR_47484_1 [Eumeta japonica]
MILEGWRKQGSAHTIDRDELLVMSDFQGANEHASYQMVDAAHGPSQLERNQRHLFAVSDTCGHVDALLLRERPPPPSRPPPPTPPSATLNRWMHLVATLANATANMRLRLLFMFICSLVSKRDRDSERYELRDREREKNIEKREMRIEWKRKKESEKNCVKKRQSYRTGNKIKTGIGNEIRSRIRLVLDRKCSTRLDVYFNKNKRRSAQFSPRANEALIVMSYRPIIKSK